MKRTIPLNKLSRMLLNKLSANKMLRHVQDGGQTHCKWELLSEFAQIQRNYQRGFLSAALTYIFLSILITHHFLPQYSLMQGSVFKAGGRKRHSRLEKLTIHFHNLAWGKAQLSCEIPQRNFRNRTIFFRKEKITGCASHCFQAIH